MRFLEWVSALFYDYATVIMIPSPHSPDQEKGNEILIDKVNGRASLTEYEHD